jgi:hypothetical protein
VWDEGGVRVRERVQNIRGQTGQTTTTATTTTLMMMMMVMGLGRAVFLERCFVRSHG